MINQEFEKYLKDDAGFYRFVQAWIQQYKKLGRFGGSVIIENLTEIEKNAIGGFMGRNLRNENNVSVSFTKLQKAIDESKFEGCDFLQVLELYEGLKISTNKEIKQQRLNREEYAFEQLLYKYKNTKAGEWLFYIISEKNKSYTKVKQLLHNENAEELHIILKGINELPIWNNKSENFAVFATRISGDPHFFDKGIHALLLYESILFFKGISDEEQTQTLEEKNKMYYDVGLLKDDLSNNCMICHINALYHGNILHEAWNGFYKNHEPWIVNLYNLQLIDQIMNDVEVIFIVENPSVFKSLCLNAKQLHLKKSGFICTNGQLNLCAFVLLDFVKKSYIKMYYAGDFDPEGLLIADKLKRRYKDNLLLWHYSEKDYECSISNKQADERRQTMLENCESEELQVIKHRMLETACCGYQEALLSYYLADIVKVG